MYSPRSDDNDVPAPYTKGQKSRVNSVGDLTSNILDLQMQTPKKSQYVSLYIYIYKCCCLYIYRSTKHGTITSRGRFSPDWTEGLTQTYNRMYVLFQYFRQSSTKRILVQTNTRTEWRLLFLHPLRRHLQKNGMSLYQL